MSVQKVRAKFWVREITRHHTDYSASPQPVTIKMSPVYGDGTDNVDWSKFTPQGDISMMITNPTASDMFALGGKYYVDFTPADPEA